MNLIFNKFINIKYFKNGGDFLFMTLKIEEFFGYNQPFTAKQLYNFYLQNENELNQGTFRWRIYNLKKRGKISSISRGVYIIEERIAFDYKITPEIKKAFNLVHKMFPDEKVSIWSTEWLHSYMTHQPFNHLIILEVDKDIINLVFEEIRYKFKNIYLNFKSEKVSKYELDENSIILKPIIKDSPIMKINKIYVPKIEKILVDLFFETDLLETYQGRERINIFEEIFNKYTINITTLYRYAKCRGIRKKIEKFLMQETKIDKKYLKEVKE